MATRVSFGGTIYLQIDASDFFAKVEYCRQFMSKGNFTRIINRTFNEIGHRLPTPIAQEIQKEYVVTQAWVKGSMGAPQIGDMEIRVPIGSHKGSIGGRFPARGLKNGRVSANIVRSGVSILPQRMTHQGGNPPFMTGGVCMTRRKASRQPIVSVKGLAVPHMPLNRAAGGVQDAILDIAEKRLMHNISFMFGR